LQGRQNDRTAPPLQGMARHVRQTTGPSILHRRAVLRLVACGGGGEADPPAAPAPPPVVPPPPPPPALPGTVVGAAGGTVIGPSGSSVVIPPGALANEVRINIELVTSGGLALPTGYTAYGPMFAFTPHGTTFALPVTMTLPFDPTAVPRVQHRPSTKQPTRKPSGKKSQRHLRCEQRERAGHELFQRHDRDPPLTSIEVKRDWTFFEYQGDALTEVELVSVPTLSDVDETYEFGQAALDEEFLLTAIGIGSVLVPPDGIAVGRIGSYNLGKTYWVGAEAPIGNAVISNSAIGSKSQLVQTQTYRKETNNAYYEFVLTGLRVEVFDYNRILDRACPEKRWDGNFCDLVGAEVSLVVSAIYLEPGRSTQFFSLAGGARLLGSAIGNQFTGTYVGTTTTSGLSEVRSGKGAPISVESLWV
jgi:hypothetical protein